MRKDVRIGLSIGGVLLAVLIVYLLVPKDANTNKSSGQQVAHNGTASSGGTSSQTGGDVSGGATAQPGTGSGATDPGTSQPHDGTTPSDAGTGQQPQDPSLASRGATTTPGADGVPSTGGADQPAQADANSGGVDWATILARGVMPQVKPDSLMATNPPPRKSTDDIFSDAPRNTPGPQPDWTNTGTTGQNGTTGQSGATGQNAVGHLPAGSGSTGTTSGGSNPTASPTEHKIQPGETFSSIALAAYGDVRYWKEIKKANPNVDDTKLKPGTVVKMPEAAAVKAAHAPAAGGSQPTNAVAGTNGSKAEAPIDPSKEYRVQPNDSLHKIALKLYGKAAKADSIYELNREKIGGDSARIKVGMVLKLPEAPTQSPTAKR